MTEQPDGIIITISPQMLKEKGYRNWLRNFLMAMVHHDGMIYYMRQGTQPRESLRDKLSYVYLCIGGKIRYRAYFAGSLPEQTLTFNGGDIMHGRAWIILSGPVERPPYEIKCKGFRGFRYTAKLF